MLSTFTAPAVLWGLLAAVPAVGAEYLYRTVKGPWWEGLWMWIPLQLSISYCVYRMVTDPGTTALIDAFITWTFATALLRVVVTVGVLGETVHAGSWAALILVVLARFTQTVWR